MTQYHVNSRNTYEECTATRIAVIALNDIIYKMSRKGYNAIKVHCTDNFWASFKTMCLPTQVLDIKLEKPGMLDIHLSDTRQHQPA